MKSGGTRWSQRNFKHGSAKAWLRADGSLSARLARSGRCFEVQVLRQARAALSPCELEALGLAGARVGYVREVLLRVDGSPVVFARSVTAHAHSRGAWRALRGLGNRPLADLLFDAPTGLTRRSPLQFAKLGPSDPLQRHIQRAWKQVTGQAIRVDALPARRSSFRRKGMGLLVMEVFADPAKPWAWPSVPPGIAPRWPQATALPKPTPSVAQCLDADENRA